MIPDMTRPIHNAAHKFGEGQIYYRAIIRDERGKRVAALFTADQLDDAVARARRNPEDAPDARPWWQKLLG